MQSLDQSSHVVRNFLDVMYFLFFNSRCHPYLVPERQDYKR